LWQKLSQMDWPSEAKSLRYITNSGGAMPVSATQALASKLPHVELYLMYGLTEAFRSTYLDPKQVVSRPDSIGKPIPHAEITINNAGELMHSGDLVAMGYWDKMTQTPIPFEASGAVVNSGDLVSQDDEGFYYFISRKDDMMKVAGYRISPTEIESEISLLESVQETVCFAVPHAELGSAIILLISGADVDIQEIEKHCQQQLPSYMQPSAILVIDSTPLNDNGKIDRKKLALKYQEHFVSV